MKTIERKEIEQALTGGIKKVLPKGHLFNLNVLIDGFNSKVKIEGVKDAILKNKVLVAYSEWLTTTIECCTNQLFPTQQRPKFSLEFI